MLKKRGHEAGVSEFSPHDLRRTFVSDLIDTGADIGAITKVARHTNEKTTTRYIRRPEEVKRKAAELFNVSYRVRQAEGKEWIPVYPFQTLVKYVMLPDYRTHIFGINSSQNTPLKIF
jgi:hypothetical protein